MTIHIYREREKVYPLVKTLGGASCSQQKKKKKKKRGGEMGLGGERGGITGGGKAYF